MSLAFLETAYRQASVTGDTSHRPWPVPDEPWVQAQTWVDLAFLHWPVDAAALRKLVPLELELDVFDGEAWLGIVPFVVTGARPRGVPPLPRLSSFAELNVRTYVTRDGKPGVWFFTLEASSTLAVEGGKRLYRLPYRRARMTCERNGEWMQYESAREGATFSARYRGKGQLFHAEEGTLEHFLTDRYRLYTADGGRVYGADIHHLPWDLQHGEAEIDLNTVAPVKLPGTDPHVLFAPRQDVVVWPLHELGDS